LDHAIQHYEAALKVWKRDEFPQEWAEAQHSLGVAWFYCIHGSREENLEQAIACYKAALSIRTRNKHPAAWAETQHNLSVAYTERYRDNRAENLELAIELLSEVLKTRQHAMHPAKCAKTWTALGTAYLMRIRGERADNIERAIKHYKDALHAQKRVGPQKERATTSHNLGIAYAERLLGDRGANLRQAIEHLNEALKEFPEWTFLWATVHNDLADSHWRLGSFMRLAHAELAAHHLEQAISHAEIAAKVYRQQDFPSKWALAQHNLGNAYCDRLKGDRAKNIENGIHHYQAALKVRTREAYSFEWAQTQNNLGIAYWERMHECRNANLEEAVGCFCQALEIHTPQAFPVDARRTARNLANLHFEEGCWSKARDAYSTAIRAAETLYRASYTPSGKEAEVIENTILYQHLVQACLEESDYAAALVYAEGGKARTFLDQMGQSAFPPPPGLPPDLLRREAELVERLREQEQALAARSVRGTEAGREQEPPHRQEIIVQRRETLDALEAVWDEMVRDYSVARSYVAARRGEPITWDDLCALVERLGRDAALVEFYTLPDKVVVFVLRDGWEAPRVHEVPLGQHQLLYRYLLPYQDEVRHHEQSVAAGRMLTHDWLSLGEHLLAPLEPLLGDAALVYLIPHGLLHYLPLHALTAAGGPFIARRVVAYAPSAAVLAHTLKSAPTGASSALVMGYTPDEEERAWFEGEAQVIAAHLHTSPRQGRRANAKVLRKCGPHARIIHLSCHGRFRSDDPAASCVYLASGEFTTLDWMALSLRADLVTLSACETGISDVKPGDDLTGLTRALLYAGASSALVTLWSVRADTTLEWMLDFYDRVWDAQGNKQTTEMLAFQQATLTLRKKYRDPYYWAPFTLVGDWH
jgi:CHAT domain-containing protein